MRTRPGLLLLAAGLAVALGIVLLAPFASDDPDGLERVAADHGFAEQARASSYEVAPDYTIPGVDDAALSTVIAGAAGVLLVAAVATGSGALLRRRARGGPRTAGDPPDPR